MHLPITGGSQSRNFTGKELAQSSNKVEKTSVSLSSIYTPSTLYSIHPFILASMSPGTFLCTTPPSSSSVIKILSITPHFAQRPQKSVAKVKEKKQSIFFFLPRQSSNRSLLTPSQCQLQASSPKRPQRRVSCAPNNDRQECLMYKCHVRG
jgi:hypothetical protein